MNESLPGTNKYTIVFGNLCSPFLKRRIHQHLTAKILIIILYNSNNNRRNKTGNNKVVFGIDYKNLFSYIKGPLHLRQNVCKANNFPFFYCEIKSDCCKCTDLMVSSNSMNRLVPSSTGGMPGARCSHPMSCAEPRTVFRAREIRLQVKYFKKNISYQ